MFLYSLVLLVFISGDKFSAFFLIQAGTKVNAATHQEKETALLIAASYSPLSSTPDVISDMMEVAVKLLQHGSNPDQQDTRGK